MKLYLVQHGEAKSEKEDPERHLTDKGKNEVEKVANAAKRLRPRPAFIFHSGKMRARQTAEIMASMLETLKAPEAASGLNPNDDVRIWFSKLLEYGEDLMIVGHLPFMEKFTSLVLCGDERAGVVRFSYGALICLERSEEGNWSLQWILAPELVRE